MCGEINHDQEFIEFKMEEKRVLEIEDVDCVNALCDSGEFCQPKFSEKRNVYILIRRKK